MFNFRTQKLWWQQYNNIVKGYDGNNAIKSYDGNTVKSYHGYNTGHRLIHCEADLATAINLFKYLETYIRYKIIDNCTNMKKKKTILTLIIF